jgi:undecaprenyl diphosphate synthase
LAARSLERRTAVSVRQRRRTTATGRCPRHIGFIPDGNRRWADARGLERGEGYQPGVEPGLRMLEACRRHGIAEASVYGFTKENVRRPTAQVALFRQACVEFALRAIAEGAALRAVGDTGSPLFPEALRGLARKRSAGDLRVNLLVNYGWQWDLLSALRSGRTRSIGGAGLPGALGSGDIPRIELVVRWGGHHRLSGFLPVQCAYADFFVLEKLWPDAGPEDLEEALAWYAKEDVTLGG